MLKYLISYSLILSLALAAPQQMEDTDSVENDDMLNPHSVSSTPIVEILDSGSSKQADGSYHFHFRAEDGSFREETAVMKNPGTKKAYLDVNGAYSYLDADGKEVIVHYTANHRGFVPQGGNIPDSISEAAKRNSQLPPAVDQRTDVDVDNDNDDVDDEEMPALETVMKV